jgi:NAD(P)-dependent dehydrogenase (short-subunit alcohol dehydrogenase family)
MEGIHMLLEKKTAIIYGAAGAIGSAVARAYAREGAKVHLAGRTESTLKEVAERISSDGGVAHAAELDVLDRAAVERHASLVAATNGGIDICFNATSSDDVQGVPLVEMPFDDFMRPVIKAVTAHHVIATTLAPHMVARRGGVILVMAGGREAISDLGGSHVAWSALAGLCRQLAAELGPEGIRVAWLLSPGSPGYDRRDAKDPEPSTLGAGRSDDDANTLLGRRPSYDDVANVATFAASDWARTMTATEINFTGGAVVD